MAPNDAVEELKATLPPIVCRVELGKLTGGLVNPRSMANEDSAGTGPADRFVVGRRVAYSRDSFMAWLSGRIGKPRGRIRPADQAAGAGA